MITTDFDAWAGGALVLQAGQSGDFAFWADGALVLQTRLALFDLTPDTGALALLGQQPIGQRPRLTLIMEPGIVSLDLDMVEELVHV